MKKRLISLLALMAYMTLSFAMSNQISFKNGKLKVVQFTDIHWTPGSPGCIDTESTIRSILKSEQPSLAVLSGDVVTEAPAKKGWNAIIRLFNELHVPFVVTMGNHDAEYMSKDSIYNYLMQSPYYAGEKGPQEIKGCGNCVLPIYGSTGNDKIAALLYFLDSNDYQPEKLYGSYDWIHFDQIDWYRKQSRYYTKANEGKPLPALAFFHIPLREYAEIVGDDKTYGTKNEDIASASLNSGAFTSFLEMKDVMGVFVGHDHDNDFLGMNKGILLAFGRVTGKDAYGDLTRGARIIELYEGQRKFNTWIATPNGRETIYYYPSGLNSYEESHMTYMPACNVNPTTQGVAYTYYEGKCKKVDEITSCKKVKKGTLKNISIGGALKKDHFAYEFRTLIRIPKKGVYRFYTYSDDGSVLYLDGRKTVDNDGGHSAKRAEGKIALDEGFHELRLLYFEDYMGEELEVGFCSKDIDETPLAADMLYLPE